MVQSFRLFIVLCVRSGLTDKRHYLNCMMKMMTCMCIYVNVFVTQQTLFILNPSLVSSATIFAVSIYALDVFLLWISNL